VCVAALHAASSFDDKSAPVIVDAKVFAPIRWVICYGQPGQGGNIVSARSEGGEHWSVTNVCATAPFHSGDAVDGHIEDDRRAWITEDVPTGPVHIHAYTDDRGASWTCLKSN